MRFMDLLVMSMNNLKRRRVRTFLTVLGVVIGSCSIVVMVSLGIGLKERNQELVESSGSLTRIQVMENFEDTGKEKKQLTDETVKEFSRLEHVADVYPILELSVMLRQGAYEATYVQLQGVPKKYLDQIPVKWKPEDGKDKNKLRLVYGNEVIKNFINRKTKKGFYETNELPKVDLMRKPVFVIFDTDAYFEAQQAESGKKPPKKYVIESAGLVDETNSKSSQYAYFIYAEQELLKEQLKRIFKRKAIPGQPTTKKGKAYPYFVYNTIEVYVDDMKHMKEVQKKLNDSGYQAYSNIEWLEQTEKQSGMIQAVLGGIGAVSLLVAAIGIANTMMMSIYERTKEIGVLKVLGCDLNAIRNMFLIESAFIGFLGGIIGGILSYVISFAMNHFLKLESVGLGAGGNLSRIPLWLFLAALFFSVFVGMAAGFFPALRAMKLSPLAAIRNQ